MRKKKLSCARTPYTQTSVMIELYKGKIALTLIRN